MKRVQFSASRTGDLLSGGTGKTRMNYIFELAEKAIGIESNLQTPAMLHGINSELDAIQILTSIYGGSHNTDGKGGQVYFVINDYIGATPDALGDDFVGDAKCQYFIHTYFEQNDKLSTKYHLQVQTQMLALNVKKGYLINYLTKPEQWGNDDWQEYPFPLKDRYFIHEINAEAEIQDNILLHAEKYYPLIGVCSELMLNATEISHDEFFYNQFVNKTRYEKLKDINWENTDRKIYRFGDTFYVERNLRNKL